MKALETTTEETEGLYRRNKYTEGNRIWGMCAVQQQPVLCPHYSIKLQMQLLADMSRASCHQEPVCSYLQSYERGMRGLEDICKGNPQRGVCKRIQAADWTLL